MPWEAEKSRTRTKSQQNRNQEQRQHLTKGALQRTTLLLIPAWPEPGQGHRYYTMVNSSAQDAQVEGEGHLSSVSFLSMILLDKLDIIRLLSARHFRQLIYDSTDIDPHQRMDEGMHRDGICLMFPRGKAGKNRCCWEDSQTTQTNR